jgi:hypothetical protein
MILENKTFERFHYYPSKLPPQSNKQILAACDTCGKIRKTSKNGYHAKCKSCAMKGETRFLGHNHTKEAKTLIGASLKGNSHALGCKHSEEQNAKNSARNKGEKNAMFGKRGVESPNYKDGKKAATARATARHKRDLKYTLLLPLTAGEVGHHVTNEYVIGIPEDAHVKLGGGGRKKHRTKVLQWLKANDKKKYKLVLCVLAKEPL